MTNTIAPVPALQVALPPDPTGASFAAYAACSAPVCAITLPEGSDPGRLRLFATTWQLPQAVLTRMTGTEQASRRGPEEIAADPAPPIILMLLQDGRVDGHINERRYTVGPGDVALYDLARPFESMTQPFTMLHAMVARERVPPALLAPGAHGLCFPAGSPAARMIAGVLTALIDALDTASMAQAEAGLTAFCNLTAGLVEAHLSAARSPRRRVQAGTEGIGSLRAAAEDYIAERCCDPGLRPADLAAHLGISRSGLYRLFEAEGGVEAVLYARRLDRVVRLPQSGRAGDRP